MHRNKRRKVEDDKEVKEVNVEMVDNEATRKELSDKIAALKKQIAAMPKPEKQEFKKRFRDGKREPRRRLLPWEIRAIRAELAKGCNSKRNVLLFILSVMTGARESEALALRCGDVYNYKEGHAQEILRFFNYTLKGKGTYADKDRLVGIREDLAKLINEFCAKKHPESPLFFSEQDENKKFSPSKQKPIGGKHWWKLVKKAGEKTKVNMKHVSPHSTRKTYAWAMYEFFEKDILKTMHCLGHKSIESTKAYLGIDREMIIEASLQCKAFDGLLD